MEQSILVSILIPCYNVSAYVRKAIESILAQTYSNLEVFIIDDASQDDTLEKVRQVKDARIKVLEFKENTEKVDAVNTALQMVKGDLIAFQDADDWSEPNRIAEQVQQFINDPSLGICFTKYRYFGEKKVIPNRVALTDSELKDEFLHFGNKKNKGIAATNCPSMMISKRVLEDTKGYHPYFKGRVAEDIHWVYRILKKHRGITVDKPLYNYYLREGSFTEMQFSGKKVKYAYSWQLLAKIIDKDINENVDLLDPSNAEQLQKLELAACEEALVESVKLLSQTRSTYENSMSYKIGKFFLTPCRLLKMRLPK